MDNNQNVIIKENLNLPLKILLLGRSGVGKTSLKSIIFENKQPKDTFKLGSTNEIQEVHFNFMNNIPITLLDTPSKENYIKQYFSTKKEIIFSNVSMLIFVVEPENNNKNESDNELTYFGK